MFRHATGRRWWGIRLAEEVDGISWTFGSYLHRRAVGTALRERVLDLCPGRDFAALFAVATGPDVAAVAERVRHLERVASTVWRRRNKMVCVRCGDRRCWPANDGPHWGDDVLSAGEVSWAARGRRERHSRCPPM